MRGTHSTKAARKRRAMHTVTMLRRDATSYFFERPSSRRVFSPECRTKDLGCLGLPTKVLVALDCLPRSCMPWIAYQGLGCLGLPTKVLVALDCLPRSWLPWIAYQDLCCPKSSVAVRPKPPLCLPKWQ